MRRLGPLIILFMVWRKSTNF